MEHHFNVEVAKKYGILEAILLNNIAFWIASNKANGRNYYDGTYWTYNSAKAFQELFPYVTLRQVQNALMHLREQGVLKTGNYNAQAYDRTLWYAFTEKGECIMQICKMDNAEKGNANGENVTPIPDINTDKKSNINTNNRDMPAKRFTPPTFEEVRAYCAERLNNVDPVHFVDYYTANDWKVGRNKMKDWRAAVRTWERNGFSSGRNEQRGANGVVLDNRQTDELDGIL